MIKIGAELSVDYHVNCAASPKRARVWVFFLLIISKQSKLTQVL